MTEYQIELANHLDLPWQDMFEALTLSHQPDGNTRLIVALPDQSALIGLLLRIHNLGLEIINLNRQTNT